MRVAVLTLTRDRLDYTQHCFEQLSENAGCAYDHYVLDQGSTDGTAEWLDEHPGLSPVLLDENVGIWRGLNILLDNIGPYDVIVNFDNDCELTVPDTLRVVAELAANHPENVIGPLVNGLNRPPQITGHTVIDGHTVGLTHVIGGILMPLPHGWRYPEGGPFIHYDNVICHQAHGTVGQLVDFPVNHYRTTAQQWADHPDYFARKAAEGIPL